MFTKYYDIQKERRMLYFNPLGHQTIIYESNPRLKYPWRKAKKTLDEVKGNRISRCPDMTSKEIDVDVDRRLRIHVELFNVYNQYKAY